MNATDHVLIGHQGAGDLLPAVQRDLMAGAGITGSYEIVEVQPADFPAAIPGILEKYAGFNCAEPFQETIIPFLAGLGRSAAYSHLASMVWQGRGYNTDMLGFLRDCPDLASHRVLLLGAGPASRTIACGAALASAQTWILDQSGEQAMFMLAELRRLIPGCKVGSCGTGDIGSAAWLDSNRAGQHPWALVNCSPDARELPFSPDLLLHFNWIYDTIYCPVTSRLALAARSRGITVRGGLNRLVSEALAAQQAWHPDAVITPGTLATVRRKLASRIFQAAPLTVILNGFMGSGKTTVGRALASSLELPLTDLDQVIEQVSGRTIPEIFAESGETAFRAIEQRELARILQNRFSQVLAVGGGALIDPAVDQIIHDAAIVVYLDTPLEMIEDRIGNCEGRPLLHGQAAERRRSLYRDRLPRYLETADLRVCATGKPEQVAALVLAGLGI